MTRRRRLPLLALALSAAAYAGFVGFDGGLGLHAPRQPVSSPLSDTRIRTTTRPIRTARAPAPPRWTAPVVAVHAIALDGTRTPVPLDGPLDLAQPLPTAPDAVELELTLGGPLTWTSPPRAFDLPTLRIPLDDPDADAVVLDLPAPDPDLSEVDALAWVQDAALAVPW